MWSSWLPHGASFPIGFEWGLSKSTAEHTTSDSGLVEVTHLGAAVEGYSKALMG